MNLLFQSEQFDRQPFLKWKIGSSYLLRLTGINIIVQKGIVVALPIYAPLITIQRGAGQFVLDLAFWGDRRLGLVAQQRWPYVWVGFSSRQTMEIEDL